MYKPLWRPRWEPWPPAASYTWDPQSPLGWVHGGSATRKLEFLKKNKKFKTGDIYSNKHKFCLTSDLTQIFFVLLPLHLYESIFLSLIETHKPKNIRYPVSCPNRKEERNRYRYWFWYTFKTCSGLFWYVWNNMRNNFFKVLFQVFSILS